MKKSKSNAVVKMKKFKTQAPHSSDVDLYLDHLDAACEKNASENGVYFHCEGPTKMAYDEVSYEQVIVFRGPHHTQKDMQVAVARITALYFFDDLRVVDVNLLKEAC